MRSICTALGLPLEEYGGVSVRIAGASDLVEQLGHEAAKRVTQQRGRWRSDIYFIYVRNSAGEQLAASAIMADAMAPDLESLMPHWNQPARGWSGRR